MEREKY